MILWRHLSLGTTQLERKLHRNLPLQIMNRITVCWAPFFFFSYLWFWFSKIAEPCVNGWLSCWLVRAGFSECTLPCEGQVLLPLGQSEGTGTQAGQPGNRGSLRGKKRQGFHLQVAFSSPTCLSRKTSKLTSLSYLPGGLYVPQSPVLDSVPVFYAAAVSRSFYHPLILGFKICLPFSGDRIMDQSKSIWWCCFICYLPHQCLWMHFSGFWIPRQLQTWVKEANVIQ